MKVAVAGALLFAVNMNVNAQFGNVLKKAKSAVVKESTQKAQEEKVLKQYEAEHPARQEKVNAEKAGGMDKYLGLDQTENGRIIYKYFVMEYGEGDDTSSNRANARGAAQSLVNILRWMKGNTEDFSAFGQTAYALDLFNNQIPEQIKGMSKSSNKLNKPLPQKEIDAFKAENARVKKLYLEYTGTKEKTAAELKAEADNKYVQDIINQNYLLNDLTDKNRQAKAVADYKAKVNAKVKEKLAPTKILGTYSTSFAWQGLPLQNYPELKEKYSSVQEMQFKTFYQKGGKYYVVKSAFRQSIDKGDNLHGAQPQKFYWPGLETPVEIPADKIQGKF
jgi:hypothetical protein